MLTLVYITPCVPMFDHHRIVEEVFHPDPLVLRRVLTVYPPIKADGVFIRWELKRYLCAMNQ